jgi:hypothetical protein
MSLINDALKRAKQEGPSPSSPAEPGTPMRPADPHHTSVGLPVYFMPVLLFVISAACFFIVKGWDSHRQTGLYPDPVTVRAREAAPQREPAAAEPTEAEITETIPPNRQFSLDESAKPAAVPPEAPAFRLQGIFYEPRRVAAIVNSTTVQVGDVVGNARVQAISRSSVTLLVDGQTKVLTLE